MDYEQWVKQHAKELNKNHWLTFILQVFITFFLNIVLFYLIYMLQLKFIIEAPFQPLKGNNDIFKVGDYKITLKSISFLIFYQNVLNKIL
jgi:hypothetical protein